MAKLVFAIPWSHRRHHGSHQSAFPTLTYDGDGDDTTVNKGELILGEKIKREELRTLLHPTREASLAAQPPSFNLQAMLFKVFLSSMCLFNCLWVSSCCYEWCVFYLGRPSFKPKDRWQPPIKTSTQRAARPPIIATNFKSFETEFNFWEAE